MILSDSDPVGVVATTHMCSISRPKAPKDRSGLLANLLGQFFELVSPSHRFDSCLEKPGYSTCQPLQLIF